DMVPEPAVLVISDDDQHVLPLRALLEVTDQVDQMLVARLHVRVARMFVEVALGLVERDLWQAALVDGLDEFGTAQATVLQVLGAGWGAGREAGEIVERLGMELEVRHRGRALA